MVSIKYPPAGEWTQWWCVSCPLMKEVHVRWLSYKIYLFFSLFSQCKSSCCQVWWTIIFFIKMLYVLLFLGLKRVFYKMSLQFPFTFTVLQSLNLYSVFFYSAFIVEEDNSCCFLLSSFFPSEIWYFFKANMCNFLSESTRLSWTHVRYSQSPLLLSSSI